MADSDIMKEINQHAYAIGMQGNMYEISNFMAEFGAEKAIGTLVEIRALRQAALDENRQPKQGRWLWDRKVAVVRREKEKTEKREYEFREFQKIIDEQKEERKRIDKRGFDPGNFWDRYKQLVEPLKRNITIFPSEQGVSIQEQLRLGEKGMYVFFSHKQEEIQAGMERDFREGKIDQAAYEKRKVDFQSIFGKELETGGLDVAGAVS